MKTPFKQLAPCANCPFRKVGAIDLRPGRLADIIDALRSGEGFLCHKRYYAIARRERQPCAGAIVYLEKLGEPNAIMQVMDRLGYYPRAAFMLHADAIIDPKRS